MVDHTINVIDLQNNRVTATYGGFHYPWGVIASPDGSTLFVDDAPVYNPNASNISVVNACTGAIVKRIPTQGLVFSSPSPDSRHIWAANIVAPGIQQIDTATGQVDATYNSVPLSQEAVSADMKTLWVTQLPATVYSIDMTTGAPNGAPIYPGFLPAQFTISPDGSTVVASDLDGHVAFIDTATRTVTAMPSIGMTSAPAFATVTPDSRYAWVGCYSGQVAIIDLHTRQIVKTLQTGGWAAGVKITDDGRRAYVSTTPDGTVAAGQGMLHLTPALFDMWRPGGVIRIFDTQTFAEIGSVPTGNVPMALTIPSGRPTTSK